MKEIKVSPYIPQNLELKKIDDKKAQVIAYPFESGFAITLAHPIRRLLLSSTVGYAPTAIKIEGIEHEFDTIKGVLEDVSVLIVNLRNIRFKIKDEEKDKVKVTYEFSSHQEIKGENFINDDIDVTAPESYVATLNDDATLKITLIIEKGIGYVASENLRDETPKGFIAIDAFFTPVTKTVYEIENVLVDDDPNFEKIVFDIETDGQVTPESAFRNALSIMNQQLHVFNQQMKIPTLKIENQAEEIADYDILFQKVDDLDIGTRAKNALSRNGILYAVEVALLSIDAVKSIKNLGKKSIEEIIMSMESIAYPVGFEFSNAQKEAINTKIQELKEG